MSHNSDDLRKGVESVYGFRGSIYRELFFGKVIIQV